MWGTYVSMLTTHRSSRSAQWRLLRDSTSNCGSDLLLRTSHFSNDLYKQNSRTFCLSFVNLSVFKEIFGGSAPTNGVFLLLIV